MNVRSRARALSLLVLFALLPGCAQKAGPSVTDLRPVESFQVGEPLTDEECQEFAAEVQRVVEEGDEKGYEGLFDWSALLDRALDGVPLTASLRVSFREEARRSIARECREVVGHVEQGGSYELLRVRHKDDQPRALFRLVLPEGGVNYHELMLARRPEGVRIVDVEMMLAGESLAGATRRLSLPAAMAASRSRLARLFSSDSEYLRSLHKLEEMAELARAGRHEEVLGRYQGLPESLRREKVVLLLRLRAAQAVEDDRYPEAMDDFVRYHPDDPCIDLVCLDHDILNGKYDEALARVDRLDKGVGGDPYLDVVRASILTEAGRLPEARSAAQKVIKARPDREDGYWAALAVSLREKRFGEALGLLETLEDEFGVAVEDLTEQPEYAELFRSEAYRTWAEKKAKE